MTVVAALPVGSVTGFDPVLGAVLAVGISLAHLLPHHLPRAVERRREGLLSLAGGVSIVYAFVHLFPELDHRRETIEGVELLGVTLVAEHIYILAVVGLAAFYGLERFATVARSNQLGGVVGDAPVFWVHVAAFAVYNGVIGYALLRGETGADSVVLFATAMGLHLFGNDQAMHEHHPRLYARYGRYVLATAVVAGAGVGLATAVDPGAYTILLGLLTGGIVFNAIKDELPRTRDSRFWAFALGATVYGAVLVTL